MNIPVDLPEQKMGHTVYLAPTWFVDLTINAMHSVFFSPLASNVPSSRLVRTGRERVIAIVNVVARVSARASNTPSASVVVLRVQVAGEVHESDITDQHVRRAGGCAVVATVLRNGAAVSGALDVEVTEEHVGDAAPAAATGLVVWCRC